MTLLAALLRLLRLKVWRFRQAWLKPVGGRAGRMRRRMVLLIGGCTFLVAVVSFPGTFMSATSRLCKTRILQPRLGDICGDAGVEGIPARAERIAWEAIPSGDCEGLDRYRSKYPKGAFRSAADARLAIVRVDYSSEWTVRTNLRDNLYVRDSMPPFASRKAAEVDAENRALKEASQRCQDFSITVPKDMVHLLSANLAKEQSTCRSAAQGGFVCSMEFSAVCHTRQRLLRQICG